MEEGARQWRFGDIHLEAGGSFERVKFSLVVEATIQKSRRPEKPIRRARPRYAVDWKVGRHQWLGLRRRLESAGRVGEVERGDSGLKRVGRTMRDSS